MCSKSRLLAASPTLNRRTPESKHGLWTSAFVGYSPDFEKAYSESKTWFWTRAFVVWSPPGFCRVCTSGPEPGRANRYESKKFPKSCIVKVSSTRP